MNVFTFDGSVEWHVKAFYVYQNLSLKLNFKATLVFIIDIEMKNDM